MTHSLSQSLHRLQYKSNLLPKNRTKHTNKRTRAHVRTHARARTHFEPNKLNLLGAMSHIVEANNQWGLQNPAGCRRGMY